MLSEIPHSPIEKFPIMTENQGNPFYSFWMGGYECSDQLNASGNRVDFLKITGHLERLDEDYQNLSQFSIRTVREGIRWSQVERFPYEYDWSTVRKMIAKGKANGIQQVWDICHFGFPDDLDPLHPYFTKRFISICVEFVKFYRSVSPDETLIVTPINEVSFLSWLGGEEAKTVPYLTGKGWEIKYQLMKAYIAGIKAMLHEDPRIRILTTEPLVNIVPPINPTPNDIAIAAKLHFEQFQTLDILCGKLCPELGGDPQLLDILGFNFYYNNQWISGFEDFLPWLNEVPDPRWVAPRLLLKKAFQRYGRPIVLTETSHPKEDRPAWIKFIAEECYGVIDEGVPLLGICLYPIIDRPDWDDLSCWHRSGLWDLEPIANMAPRRNLYQPYADALLQTQQRFNIASKIPYK